MVVCSIGLLLQSGFMEKSASSPIEWLTLEQAQKRNETTPKKIIIDFYTDWCGWCKKMDKDAFGHQDIAAYVNEHFYAVKFDAETQDTILFKGQPFGNTQPGYSRGTHEIAANMCAVNGRIGYPTIVLLDEDLSIIAPVPGYQSAKSIEPILHFIAGNHYKTEQFPAFQASFQGKVQ